MADCQTCGDSNPSYYTNPLTPCTTQLPGYTDASKIQYTGTNLTCLNKTSGSTLQSILQAVDAAACNTTLIPWSTFNYGCLSTGYTINSAQTFAERVSSYVCTLNTTVGTNNTTLTSSITNLTNQINGIKNPAFSTSCIAVGITSSDTLNQAIQKIVTNLCSVNSSLNPSAANWNSCYTVSPLPTTIVGGFNTLISQICALKTQINGAGSANLPLFDNTGTCLATPTSTDTLYNTVVKIRTKLCSLPTFDINNVAFTSCITKGSNSTIEDLFTNVIAKLQQAYSARVLTFDPTYFTTTYTTPGDTCSGKVVTLSSTGTDKMVALSSTDTPNYLLQKIQAGTGVTFDTVTTPGKVIINSTGGTGSSNYTIKASSADSTPDYLVQKVTGAADTAGIVTINTALSGTNDYVSFTPNVNYKSLAGRILSEISSDTSLTAIFNAMVCNSQPCTSPPTTYGTISGTIVFGESTHSSINMSVKFTQLSPTLSWYDSNLIIGASTTINTGSYSITSPASPLQGTLIIVNHEAFSVGYNVAVFDASNSPVSGASTPSGTLTAGSTLTINPFSYGHSSNTYRIRITFTA